MYDRERDYNWVYDANNQTAGLSQGVGVDTDALTVVSFLSETDEERSQRKGITKSQKFNAFDIFII